MRNKKQQPIVSLDTICEHITQREIKAQKASRDSNRYMQCIYMENNVGKVYKAIISSVVDFGLYAELEENRIEGLIKSSTLPQHWNPDVANHCFKNSITGETIRLGDELHVVIESIDIDKKTINFTIFY